MALRRAIISLFLLLVLPVSAFAWPALSQWHSVQQGGNSIHDPQNDAGGSRNIVPDAGSPAAAYIYNDGVNIYFRFRLDESPAGSGGQGLLLQYGWGFEIDTDQNADDYEWLMMLDGISSPEVIRLMFNSEKSHLGDPSDIAEDVIAPYPLAGNYRIVAADTCYDSKWNPGGVCNASYTYRDNFLDYKIPYTVFKQATGITDQSLIRFFVGSSSSANNLTENGADLVAGSDLYTMGSDYVTPFGYLPPGTTYYNGTVRFVNDLNGGYNRTLALPGEILYIRVDDLDLTDQSNPGGTLVVTVISPTGDSERVTLQATGVQGKYTGQLPTSSSYSNGNSGTLYILSGQTATVTYQDAITAARVSNVNRTDTIYFSSTATDIALTKTVDNPAPNTGETVTFTVTATNNGPSAVSSLTVTDTLPAGLTYSSHQVTQGSFNSSTRVWTINTVLAAGASATLTLRATVNAGTYGQTLANTATLSASTPADGQSSNNSATATLTVGGTDLKVMKSVDNATPAVGNTVVYTVRVINVDLNNASAVSVTDLLPTGMTYQSYTASQGTYNSGTGLWNVGALASAQGAILQITATANSAGQGKTLVNTATLSGATPADTNPANNSASVSTTVGFTDLVLNKSVRLYAPTTTSFGDSVSANTGATVEFRLDVTNNGPHTGTNIAVTDTFPSGLTYVAGSVSATHGSYNTSTGMWTLGTLASGATASLTFRATVNSGTAGQSLLNMAEITAIDQKDSNPGNEYDEAVVAVNGTDLRIVKSVNNPTPNPGDQVTWTITVANDGPNPASSITVSDRLLSGLSRVSHTTTQGTWDATGGNPSWVWSVGALAVNASATLTVVTSINSGTTGKTIANDAFVTGSSLADPDNGNNVASDYVYVGGTDLSIAKSVNDATPSIGQTIVYTLTATNDGTGAATGVTVNDLLPPEVRYVSHSPAGASYNAATGIWSIGNLAGGATATLDITATVLNEDRHLVVTNTARVSANQADPNPSDNTARADIHVNAVDLAVTKTEENGTAAPAEGQTITYLITVENTSPTTATGVEIEDVLPSGVTLVSATPDQGTYAAGVWLAGNVVGGGSAALRIRATVNPFTTGTTITNTATLIYLDQLESDPDNDSASWSIAPRQRPVLTILKSADKASAAPGEVITYTVTVLNGGSAAATNVILNDDLSPYTAWGLDSYGAGQPFQLAQGAPPSGLAMGTPEYSNNNGTDWNHPLLSGGGNAPAGFDGEVTDWRLPMTGTMDIGGSFTLRYKVMVK